MNFMVVSIVLRLIDRETLFYFSGEPRPYTIGSIMRQIIKDYTRASLEF